MEGSDVGVDLREMVYTVYIAYIQGGHNGGAVLCVHCVQGGHYGGAQGVCSLPVLYPRPGRGLHFNSTVITLPFY